MVEQFRYRLLLFALCLFITDLASCQDMYFLQSTLVGDEINWSVLMKYNGQTCELQEVYDFKNELNTSINPWSLSFHPDGRLYFTSIWQDSMLVAFNTLKGKIDKIEPIALAGGSHLAISEEGKVLITEFIGDGYNYIDYDFRQNQRIQTYTPEEFFGKSDIAIPIGGFLKNNDLLFYGATKKYTENQYIWGDNTYAYWDTDAGKYDTVLLHDDRKYFFRSPSIYLPPCESRQMLSTGSFNDLQNNELIRIDMEDLSIFEICPGQLFPKPVLPIAAWAINSVANSTDFRQSTLRIDLDNNNSSYHPTAGYYDTLTICRQEAPVTDEDVSLSTCGAEVDYISFRLAYYNQPRLLEEFLTAEGYEDDLKLISPSRWEWHNPYGGNKERIKEFLLSLRYHANWDPDDPDASRERVVITTMHVGEDSTSSWTVYQLELDEIYAGRDTTVEYCLASSSLDLRTYLSEDAVAGGRFDPEPSRGDGLFIPGTDFIDQYLYIVESSGGGCADTALITLEESATQELPFDDVRLCSGQDMRIGLPPGDYENAKWWNGETGDSTTTTSADTGPFWVELQLDGCTFHADFEVISKNAIYFPESYPDTLEICPSEQGVIAILDLDSVDLEGLNYLPGEQVMFSGPGDYIMTGYLGGCSISKTITVTYVPDPSDNYTEVIDWCEGTPLILSLPNDSAGMTFFWSDGIVSRERPIMTTGDYHFDIQTSHCSFQSQYTVILDENSKCGDIYKCTVSIPNAVTPNRDGWNDDLEIFFSTGCGALTSITLWDKWGGLRYKTTSPKVSSKVWEDLPVGIYIVQVVYENESGNTMTETGSVILIR